MFSGNESYNFSRGHNTAWDGYLQCGIIQNHPADIQAHNDIVKQRLQRSSREEHLLDDQFFASNISPRPLHRGPSNYGL